MTKITPFDESPHAPFPLGQVPISGWFCIEPPFSHTTPQPRALAQGLGIAIPDDLNEIRALDFAEAHGFGCEVATVDTLRRLADNFNPGVNGGKGLLITRDHASLKEDMDSRAAGWIKSLHCDGHYLWAWIEWTPWGHTLVNNGEFEFFSTEYEYSDYIITPRGAEPQRLTACTITNENRHKGQVPCSNTTLPERSGQPKTTMIKQPSKATARARNTDAPTEEKPPIAENAIDGESIEKTAANTDDELIEETAANADCDKRDETAANAEPGAADDIDQIIVDIADMLELPESAAPSDLKEAVAALIQSNKELTDALASANKSAGTATNTGRRYARLTIRKAATNALRGDAPNRAVNVAVGGRLRAVNTQDKAKADYCRAAVSRRETALGRTLTPGEYSRVYGDAMRNFDLGVNR